MVESTDLNLLCVIIFSFPSPRSIEEGYCHQDWGLSGRIHAGERWRKLVKDIQCWSNDSEEWSLVSKDRIWRIRLKLTGFKYFFVSRLCVCVCNNRTRIFSHVPFSLHPVTWSCCTCVDILKIISIVCPAHCLISAFPCSWCLSSVLEGLCFTWDVGHLCLGLHLRRLLGHWWN